MPIDPKPLFRPDVLRPLLAGFSSLPPTATLTARKWADLLSSQQAESLNEKELLPDFLYAVLSVAAFVAPTAEAELCPRCGVGPLVRDGEVAPGVARPAAAVERVDSS